MLWPCLSLQPLSCAPISLRASEHGMAPGSVLLPAACAFAEPLAASPS